MKPIDEFSEAHNAKLEADIARQRANMLEPIINRLVITVKEVYLYNKHTIINDRKV